MMNPILTPEQKSILSFVDHTLLAQNATWEQIRTLCDEGAAYGTASVCIPPSFVRRAADYLTGSLPVCTVIGFPNGYNTTEVKVYETKKAIEDGAVEIDMVIAIGELRAGDFAYVEQEIRAIREATGKNILKVIIETCLLTEEEKIAMCRIVTAAGADFIKTSTGFSTGGATLADIELFRAHVGPDVRIKAAGGISTLDDAKAFLAAGASRLGTSRVVKIIRDGQAVQSGY